MTAPALTLTITTAGLNRFTAAQASEDIDLTVASVGLTADPFVSAPTLTALPGEFRRLATISGDQIGDNLVHMIVRDDEPLEYDVRGFGLFLADGTLFAFYGQDGLIASKAGIASLLIALDVVFPTDDITQLTFGDTNFLNPPATTETKGVVELATLAEGVVGLDPMRVPPVAVVRDMIQTWAPESAQASIDAPGVVELATVAEGLAGTDPTRVPPVYVAQVMLETWIPRGVILLWAGVAATVPQGWALCDGRTVDRTDGAGSLTTPDLRGRVPIGASDTYALGQTYGATSADSSAAGAHVHTAAVTVDAAATGAGLTTTVRSVDAGGSANNVLTSVVLNDPGHAHAATATVEIAGEHSHTVDPMQPSIALNYIMKV